MPVAVLVLALYAIGSVILRQRDPFHMLLLAGTAGVLVLVVCAALGMSVSRGLLVVPPPVSLAGLPGCNC